MTVTVSSSTRAILAQLPDVEVRWTRDQNILKGRRARWFPRPRIIAVDAGLRRTVARCSLMHELAHVVLDHPAACDNHFFDQRVEADADRLAARLLLPDVEEIAIELATTSTHSHAARNLRVTLDMLEARLEALTPTERSEISERVWNVHDGIGA